MPVSQEKCRDQQAVGSVCHLPARSLRTSYALLRPGAPLRRPDEVVPMPIRVVPTEDGSHEVLDGFYAELETMRSFAVAGGLLALRPQR